MNIQLTEFILKKILSTTILKDVFEHMDLVDQIMFFQKQQKMAKLFVF